MIIDVHGYWKNTVGVQRTNCSTWSPPGCWVSPPYCHLQGKQVDSFFSELDFVVKALQPTSSILLLLLSEVGRLSSPRCRSQLQCQILLIPQLTVEGTVSVGQSALSKHSRSLQSLTFPDTASLGVAKVNQQDFCSSVCSLVVNWLTLSTLKKSNTETWRLPFLTRILQGLVLPWKSDIDCYKDYMCAYKLIHLNICAVSKKGHREGLVILLSALIFGDCVDLEELTSRLVVSEASQSTTLPVVCI